MGIPHITNRKFTFCPRLSELPLSNLIVQCDFSGRFYGACCSDNSLGGDLSVQNDITCHHLQLVFSDGACPNNGKDNARAGLGVVIGTGEGLSWSIPVNDAVDPDGRRTSQRAELLAAIEGLERLHKANMEVGSHAKSRHKMDGSTYIVVTDSEYVVNGITEWFRVWENRNWRTSAGKTPKNLDLFSKLDEIITKLEKKRISVGFWRIPRAYNWEADSLAKLATVL